MGMQCTFDEASAIDQNCELDKTYHPDSDTWSAVIWDKGMEDAFITVNYTESGNEIEPNNYCWFDVGRGTAEQLAKLAWLIHRRIPFVCA
jgi:hypothetical protein